MSATFVDTYTQTRSTALLKAFWQWGQSARLYCTSVDEISECVDDASDSGFQTVIGSVLDESPLTEEEALWIERAKARPVTTLTFRSLPEYESK